jgi:hypothetical protein
MAIVRFVLRHAVAALAAFVVTAAFPVLVYAFLLALAIVTDRDLGGRVLPFVVPVLSLLFALCACVLVFFPLAALGELACRLRGVRVGIFFVLGLCVSASIGTILAAAILGTDSALPLLAFLGLWLGSGLFAYWTVLSGATLVDRAACALGRRARERLAPRPDRPLGAPAAATRRSAPPP